MRRLLSIVCVIALAAISAPEAVAQRRGNPQAGPQLALRVCDACHIVAADQMPPLVPGYAPNFFDVGNRPGTTADSLRAFLASPHPLGNMPYPELSTEQLLDVSTYMMSLRARC